MKTSQEFRADRGNGRCRRRHPWQRLATSGLRRWREPGVLHVVGEVDQWTAPSFRAALIECDDDPCIHALDLTEVDFFSAAGVSCFVERAWPVRPHAAIIASGAVRQVLTLCDLEYLLERHGWCRAEDGRGARWHPWP